MRAKLPIPAPLLALIERQAGVFSADQALAAGCTRAMLTRLRREGHWHPLAKGVWSTRRQPEWAGLAWAGVLLGGPAAGLGGEAAWHLWELGPPPSVIDVIAPRRCATQGPWRFRLGHRDFRGDLPRSSVEDTTADVCAAASRDDSVVAALSAAIGSRRTTAERLRSRFRELPTLRHRQLALDVLSECRTGIESPLERRYLRDVEQAHGLPRGMRQARIMDGTRTDVAYRPYGVLVELDGRAWHAGIAASNDLFRDNEALLLGLLTLRYGWLAVTGQACRVAAQVARALAAGGWSGQLTPCPHCPARPPHV